MEGSRMSGMMYELESAYGDNYKILGPAIDRQWEWVGWPDPDAELQRAIQWCYSEGQPIARL